MQNHLKFNWMFNFDMVCCDHNVCYLYIETSRLTYIHIYASQSNRLANGGKSLSFGVDSCNLRAPSSDSHSGKSGTETIDGML